MIKPKFSQADLKKLLALRFSRIEEAILSRLLLVGEEFVRNARENGSYNDITGNLRSSVGYVVLKHGQIIKQNFEKAGRGSDGETGISKAKTFINNVVSRFPRGYVLVGFAGMEYAASVESKGKDVITSSAVIAERSLKQALKAIDRKILAA